MQIILPQEIIDCVSKLGNKTKQKSAYKIYAALTKKEPRKNKFGFFPVPATYLEKINNRYRSILTAFEEAGVLQVFQRRVQDTNDIFTTKLKPYYNTNLNVCKKYRFTIDITKGQWTEIEFENKRKLKWFSTIERSLAELGYDGTIARDNFGLRVHHPVIPVYKTELKGKGFAVIDAKASQPKLLLNIMKEQGIVDERFQEAFKVDFYTYLEKKLNLDNRKQAKDLFMYWLNSAGYVPNYSIHTLFPIATKYIKSLKNKYFKDAASYMQRIEAKIWIDDLLENIPVQFALPVHDSLIVRSKEAYEVLAYCQEKYPEIDFEKSFID